LKADGSVVGWGINHYGQSTNQDGPFVAIAAGDRHSLGLKADGSVVGWGYNDWGQRNNQRGNFTRNNGQTNNQRGNFTRNNGQTNTQRGNSTRNNAPPRNRKITPIYKPPKTKIVLANLSEKRYIEGHAAQIAGIVAVHRHTGDVGKVYQKLVNYIKKEMKATQNRERRLIVKNINLAFDNRRNLDKMVKKLVLQYLKR
jgi:hypothetical protein